MKVSWHGNRKHISARWHTKGLPVLHVAFLRERIQRGFKCYHDLTHKISQLWLTRLPDFYSFIRPCSSCYSLFLPVIWSTASTFLLNTKYILARCTFFGVWKHELARIGKNVACRGFRGFLVFRPLAVPSSHIMFHLPVDAGEVLIGKQREPIYLSFHLISYGKFHRLQLRRPDLLPPCAHARTHTRSWLAAHEKSAKNAKKPEKKVIFLQSAASFLQQTHSTQANIKADNHFQKCKLCTTRVPPNILRPRRLKQRRPPNR